MKLSQYTDRQIFTEFAKRILKVNFLGKTKNGITERVYIEDRESRVPDKYFTLFVRHNQKLFKMCGFINKEKQPNDED